jgi:hypothetical protein
MFLIIFGSRNSAKTLAMLTLACRNGHVAAHRITKLTRKFTLFFIPLFSTSHRYYSTCAACGLQLSWDKDTAEAAVAQAQQQQADSAGGQGMRYWNGSAWTESVHDG